MTDSMLGKRKCLKRTAPLIRRSLVAACIWALGACVFSAADAYAQVRRQGAVPVEVGIEQRLNQQVPLDAEFSDEAGRTVRLGEYFGKKPVILSLVYYDCPMLCTLALNGLLQSLQAIKLTAGKDFTVVTVSIDPREKPELAAAKKRVYLTLYNRPGGWNGWPFLTGTEESIRPLADAVGFRYKWDAESSQYAHATGIMVLTPEGRVSRYFYGIEYPSSQLRLSLIEASGGKIGSPIDQVLLFCYHYDPTTGKYGLVITRVLQLAAAVTVFLLGAFILMMTLREKRRTAARIARN